MIDSINYQVKRIKEGDRELYLDVVEVCYDKCLAYAQEILKCSELATTVLDDIWVQLWEQRQSLAKDVSVETQLCDLVFSRVLEVFKSAASNRSLREKIWDAIKANQKFLISPILDQEQESIIKVIHNNILQHQLIHQLAATRR